MDEPNVRFIATNSLEFDEIESRYAAFIVIRIMKAPGRVVSRRILNLTLA